MILEWRYNEDLKTVITVDNETRTVSIENKTDNIFDRAFGVNENPTYADFEKLLKDRCFSDAVGNCKILLNSLGLKTYNRIDIVRVTNGKMAHDKFSLVITEE